ncbi:hypothetical protein RFI_23099 [Reticulomyxa filosa]|uniref:mitogen-activated protein kinase kinase n=1 Tax=Reticulomyxa filosa TaxID=46433 RepID=X6MMG1_RETFI|nr:hypothetical protein RFI_23099 [Reticulomyxa filosa]|eukprot:ETO14270.1 hypothetical protein RFI_23099 [Reticulomyxa filosa]
MQELRTLLHYKNVQVILRCTGAYFEEGKIVVAMDYFDRGSLQSMLSLNKCQKNNTFESGLPVNVLSYIAYNILMQLRHFHDNWQCIHRDIKPDNVLVDSSGRVSLTDFGISSHTKTFCEEVVGTTSYMSPERLMAKQYTFNSDIWSLGIMLMTCFLGKYPLKQNEELNEDNEGHWGVMHAFVMNYDAKPPVSFLFTKMQAQKSPTRSENLFLDFVTKWFVLIFVFFSLSPSIKKIITSKDASVRSNARDLLLHPFVSEENRMSQKQFAAYLKEYYEPTFIQKNKEDAYLTLKYLIPKLQNKEISKEKFYINLKFLCRSLNVPSKFILEKYQELIKNNYYN